MTAVPQFALFDESLELVDGRRHIVKALPERHKLNVAADRRELTFAVRNTPAIEGKRLDLVEAVQLGDLERHRLRVCRAPIEGEQVTLLRPHMVRHAILVDALRQSFSG